MDFLTGLLVEAAKKAKPKLIPEDTTDPKDLLPKTEEPEPKEEETKTEPEEDTTNPQDLLPKNEEPETKEETTTEDEPDEDTTNPSDLLPKNDAPDEPTETEAPPTEGGAEEASADEEVSPENELPSPEGTEDEEGETPEGEEIQEEQPEEEGPLNAKDKMIQKKTYLAELRDLLDELQYTYDILFKYLNTSSLQTEYSFLLSDVLLLKQLIINYINVSFLSDTNIMNKMKYSEFVVMYELISDSIKKIKIKEEN